MWTLLLLTVVAIALCGYGLVQLFFIQYSESDQRTNEIVTNLHDLGGVVCFVGGFLALCILWN
jgi:hypothetical protein